jgi:enamine deaminase RidA (YjgF/YER057c/UK114 family)
MTNTLAIKQRTAPPAGSGLVTHFTGGSVRSHSVIRLGEVLRVVLMLTPQRGGSLADQVAAILAVLRETLGRQEWPMTLVTQTVFLQAASDQAAVEHLFGASDLHRATVQHYVVESPANGARVAVEAWAVGGPGVKVERHSPHAVTVRYDGIRWVHVGGIKPRITGAGVYEEALDVFEQTAELLTAAGLGWEHVVRTWWQLEQITGTEGYKQRYSELNRARADAFAGLHFGVEISRAATQSVNYPASTGIGMESGAGLTLGALAMETPRREVRLLALENPWQTPAYDYAPRYSPQSPKFSRAIALVTPGYTTTWVSGTASILHSEACHRGDIVAQTGQTLDNIAALIAPDNFAQHGVSCAGATLSDLAKVRVYIKRAADYTACRAICEKRLGHVPAIYVVADICRPELLMEIEGVAFARRPTPATSD